MPENNEPPTNTDWLISVLGHEHELPIRAAYIATSTSEAQDLSGAPRVTLKDADHKIVFQSTAGSVQYVRRDGYAAAEVRPTAIIPLPGGLNATPGQLRDLQDSVNEALAMGCPKITFCPSGSSVTPYSARDLQAPR